MQYKSLFKKYKKYQNHYPRHIAIIMDGNRRWAKKKGKICIIGHRAGFEALKKAIKFALLKNLEILTVYAFSRENWNRSLFEVEYLMELFSFLLESEMNNFKKYNIRFKVMGDVKLFNKKLQNIIYQAEKITLNNNGLILNIAANYGGRWDIIQSVKKIINKVQKGVLQINKIKEDTFSQYLSTNELLPVDLVIRTGGEKRISNFLLWQIAYSELYFTDILWPDFDQNVFQDAIDSFKLRERRFGGF
ncbi:di-trans,poly-cis-decaprenylcistransferase [Buchnera aphidicola (Macrosiphoniella sanborni)]|uniref:Ditrans,polycis-undecaprenyl-diphosphate synthase ((2E,6E)-farnesyl-diphosphate specific) n=1 Tax=Buchnera aphidicola (Macrosiphoniella sanborni) TaxID=1241865 RepID=A0A4D6YCU3_9GAMM|nr:polyprenyl diphosphate synthase [Buchnera aphidicola]QCI23784.1 di-trans,poly-cis-decaprenylcistransferase [Buchnera aphidicola (Macrosiphoniella sanborni)]